MQNHLSAKLLAEFIGTFAFVFIGAGAAAVVGTGAGLNGIAAIAFAHGLTIMVFAFAYRNLSGAHFNPAVTVGVLAARAMSIGEAIAYIISQLVAAVCAALPIAGVARRGRHRPRPARARAKCRSRRNDTHDHARSRIRDRGRARLFSRHRRAHHRSRPQRRQPRAYRYRNDRGSQHHDGRRLDRRQLFNPAVSLGPMIATANFHQCLAVCNRSDRRRSCCGLDPQSSEIACRGRDRSGAARHGPGGMISPSHCASSRPAGGLLGLLIISP